MRLVFLSGWQINKPRKYCAFLIKSTWWKIFVIWFIDLNLLLSSKKPKLSLEINIVTTGIFDATLCLFKSFLPIDNSSWMLILMIKSGSCYFCFVFGLVSTQPVGRNFLCFHRKSEPDCIGSIFCAILTGQSFFLYFKSIRESLCCQTMRKSQNPLNWWCFEWTDCGDFLKIIRGSLSFDILFDLKEALRKTAKNISFV